MDPQILQFLQSLMQKTRQSDVLNVQAPQLAPLQQAKPLNATVFGGPNSAAGQIGKMFDTPAEMGPAQQGQSLNPGSQSILSQLNNALTMPQGQSTLQSFGQMGSGLGSFLSGLF